MCSEQISDALDEDERVKIGRGRARWGRATCFREPSE